MGRSVQFFICAWLQTLAKTILSVSLLFMQSCKVLDGISSGSGTLAENESEAVGIAVSVDMGPGKTAVLAFQYLDQSIGKILGDQWRVEPFGSFRCGFLVTKTAVTRSELDRAFLLLQNGLDKDKLKGIEIGFEQKAASFDTFAKVTPEFPQYQGLDTSNPEWHLIFMDVFKAWDQIRVEKKRQPGEGIIIGQIDTGLLPHPEINENGQFVSQILWDKSKNFVEKDPKLAADPYVTEGDKPVPSHGTATASVLVSPRGGVARGGESNAFVTGIAPGAKLLPLRATSSAVLLGAKQLVDVANAVGEARKQGAKVITLSLGGRPDPFLWAAIRKAVAEGVIVVVAGGANSSIQPWPGQFSETILATTGTIECAPWEDATFGKSVDIMAPGVDIWHATTYKRRDGEMLWARRRGIGTSFSAPLVAGAAAIWLSYHGWDYLAKRYGIGNVYKVFRKVLLSPAGHRSCKGLDPSKHGAGYLNVLDLINAPLPSEL